VKLNLACFKESQGALGPVSEEVAFSSNINIRSLSSSVFFGKSFCLINNLHFSGQMSLKTSLVPNQELIFFVFLSTLVNYELTAG